MATPMNQVSPKQGIFSGLLLAGAGVVIILRAANVIQAGAIHAPNWVVGVAGMVFLLPGLFMMYQGVRAAVAPHGAAAVRDPNEFSIAGWLLGGSIVTGLGLIGAWVAFGPGARTFEGGVTGSAIEGRIAFGIGAVITLAVAAFVWVNGFRQLLAGRKGGEPGARPKRMPSPRPPRH